MVNESFIHLAGVRLILVPTIKKTIPTSLVLHQLYLVALYRAWQVERLRQSDIFDILFV